MDKKSSNSDSTAIIAPHQPGDLVFIMNYNDYWNGTLVKITSPRHTSPLVGINAYGIEIVLLSTRGSDPQDPHYGKHKVGDNVGPWSEAYLFPAKNLVVDCPHCHNEGVHNSATITATTRKGTAFKCSVHGVCGLRHDARNSMDHLCLTPGSTNAWVRAAVQNQEPVCTCDVFIRGCTCARLKWEKNQC